MKLNLIRPIAFIDLETTGIDIVRDRIIQIAVLKVFPDGNEEMKTWIINPTIPIPAVTSEIHGMYDEDVKDKPTFADISNSLANYINDSDLAGYNSNRFDIPLLIAEFLRVDIDFKLEGRNIIDVQTIFHKMEPRSLRAAYKYYCGEELIGAHDAENDIRATYEVLKSQLERYENAEYEDKDGNKSYPIKNDIDVLQKFTPFDFLDPTKKLVYDDQNQVIFNFGKYKGELVAEAFKKEPNYYKWMMEKEFSSFTKIAVTKIWQSIHQTDK